MATFTPKIDYLPIGEYLAMVNAGGTPTPLFNTKDLTQQPGYTSPLQDQYRLTATSLPNAGPQAAAAYQQWLESQYPGITQQSLSGLQQLPSNWQSLQGPGAYIAPDGTIARVSEANPNQDWGSQFWQVPATFLAAIGAGGAMAGAAGAGAGAGAGSIGGSSASGLASADLAGGIGAGGLSGAGAAYTVPEMLAGGAYSAGAGTVGGTLFDQPWGVNPQTTEPVWGGADAADNLYNGVAGLSQTGTIGSPSFGQSVLDLLKGGLGSGNGYGGLVNAAVSLGSALINSGAAKSAAQTQANATNAALAQAASQNALTRADLAPWVTSGQQAVGTLGNLLGVSNGTVGASPLTRQFTTQDFWNDPVTQLSYQFGLDQGTRALNNQARARGMLNSGAQLKGLTRYATDYTGQQAAGSQQRFIGDQTNLYNRLAGLSGTGQTAATQTGAFGSNYAGNIGSLLTASGNAQAASQLAGAGQIGGALTNIGNYFGQQDTLNKLLSQRGNYGY